MIKRLFIKVISIRVLSLSSFDEVNYLQLTLLFSIMIFSKFVLVLDTVVHIHCQLKLVKLTLYCIYPIVPFLLCQHQESRYKKHHLMSLEVVAPWIQLLFSINRVCLGLIIRLFLCKFVTRFESWRHLHVKKKTVYVDPHQTPHWWGALIIVSSFFSTYFNITWIFCYDRMVSCLF